MDNLIKLIDELTVIGEESGFDGNEGVGVEMLSFNALNTYFNKTNTIALKLLGYFKINPDDKIVSMSIKDLTLKKNIVKDGYLTFKEVEVFKASSFVGNVAPFLRLMDANRETIKSVDVSLVVFEKSLAKLISHPEDVTKPCTGIVSSNLPNGTKLLNELKVYFEGKQGIDKAKLSKLYSNLKEVQDAGLVSVDLTSKFNSTEAMQIKGHGDDLYTSLEYLEDEIKDKGLEMGKDWKKVIGKELYVITEWLAIYSLYIAKLVAVTTAHRDTIAKLNSLN